MFANENKNAFLTPGISYLGYRESVEGPIKLIPTADSVLSHIKNKVSLDALNHGGSQQKQTRDADCQFIHAQYMFAGSSGSRINLTDSTYLIPTEQSCCRSGTLLQMVCLHVPALRCTHQLHLGAGHGHAGQSSDNAGCAAAAFGRQSKLTSEEAATEESAAAAQAAAGASRAAARRRVEDSAAAALARKQEAEGAALRHAEAEQAEAEARAQAAEAARKQQQQEEAAHMAMLAEQARQRAAAEAEEAEERRAAGAAAGDDDGGAAGGEDEGMGENGGEDVVADDGADAGGGMAHDDEVEGPRVEEEGVQGVQQPPVAGEAGWARMPLHRGLLLSAVTILLGMAVMPDSCL